MNAYLKVAALVAVALFGYAVLLACSMMCWSAWFWLNGGAR